ncbi:MAG: pyridoxal phosphate-dependent decarboxylase family protein [Pseudomonadota bacterium]
MRDARHAVEETLDPEDWTELRAVAHRMVDDAIDHVAGVRDRAAWRDMPETVHSRLRAPLPVEGAPMDRVYQDYRETSAAYPMGNIHPRFWGWFMGAGNFAGALGDFLAAIDGSNLGGGNTGPAALDRQVTGWLKEMMGFPADAGAMLTSGGSVANMVGLVVARNVMSGIDLRERGVRAMPQPLRFYGSEQMHSCHQKAMEVLGLGNTALRRIPVDDRLRMDMGALARAVAEDRAAGWKPACVIASAGTVNTGSVDPLEEIADFCAAEGLWNHVDGCIGALLAIAPGGRALVKGLGRADSLALDPHKWLHAPFVAGCALVRDRRAHFGAFTLHGEYLQEQARGLAAGEFLADYGMDLSRGFQALKVWMALKHHGVAKFGRLIDQNIAQAAHLADRVRGEPLLALMAPQVINVVCFRYAPEGLGEDDLRRINTEIMLRIQEAGTAVPTDTTIGGQHCLRVAITNHRTRVSDLDLLVEEVLRIGRQVAG